MSDELTELPEGWVFITLNEVGRWSGGGTPSKANRNFWEGGNIPWVSPKDMKVERILETEDYITEQAVASSSTQKITPNSILVVTRSGILERTLPIAINVREVTINQDIKAISPEVVEPEYLLNVLKRYERNILEACSKTGTTVASIESDRLKNFEIPCPPLNEQKRIVAKIEELHDRLQRSKQALEAIPELCDRFRQSVLAAAFRGDLTADWREENPDVEPASVLLERIKEERSNELEQPGKAAKRPHVPQPEHFDVPESWEIILSHDLFSFITSGSRGWAQYYSDDGATFIRVGNLDRDTICLDLTDIQRVSPPEGVEGTRTRVQPGDILISITADIGMVGVVPIDISEAYINQHVALARPLKSFCREYLAWYLASSRGGFEQFKQLQRGATKTGLGLDDIRSVWIPFPSLQEQKEIVKRVEQLFRAIEFLESQRQGIQEQVDQLNRSILAKAFRGELVEQDPNDEPASVLLDRIRAERESLQANKKSRSPKGRSKKE